MVIDITLYEFIITKPALQPTMGFYFLKKNLLVASFNNYQTHPYPTTSFFVGSHI